MSDANVSQSGSGSCDYDLLDRLADEFAERYRRGERPSFKEHADRYPDLAEDILALFPAMVDLEHAEEVRQDGEAAECRTAAPQPMPSLSQVGDYRILREIGHGGMGVVYEAEQVSLGRRVALKMLPRHVALEPRMLERFRREARAAARLHQTNIVPVFEVGREGVACYYAMQYIQGQGLDLVFEEVRRFRGRAKLKEAGRGAARDAHETGTGVETTDQANHPTTGSPPRASISRVAQSLLTGRFESDVDVLATVGCDMTAVVTPSDQPGETQAGTANGLEDGGLIVSPSASSAISGVLPGGTQVSTAESGRPAYSRSVARIGLQVAQGLAYAHARGVVHRDIKPSNLLLDTAGVVWITDFGLAKAYVYGLGLTLYELLTLEPAFDAPDRLRLIEQVKSEEPIRPRSLDHRIPRDLETIVLKAIDKDQKRRYPTADAMAEDLRRFLDDETILARRATSAERLARWARMNPGVAALGGILAAVLVLATTASLIVAGRMRSLAIERGEAAQSEHGAKLQAQAAQKRAEAASREADSQRAIAEDNFGKARRAVGRYFTQVSQSE